MFTGVQCTQHLKEKTIMKYLKGKNVTHPFWVSFNIMFDGPANEKAGDVLTLCVCVCVYCWLPENAFKEHTYLQSVQVSYAPCLCLTRN